MLISVTYDRGTLLVHNCEKEQAALFPFLQWDERVQKFRCQAFYYRDLILGLRAFKLNYEDEAKQFAPVTLALKKQIVPRAHQAEALEAWTNKGSRGVVILPTGAGKTILAVMAIAKINRATLVHVPTLDLMHQWFHVLSEFFSEPIGLLGGGYHDIKTITVSTYDSACLHVSHLGAKFGFLVFDECHHLPGEQMQYAAVCALAPFRLGLTATPESTPTREQRMHEICGPFCFQAHIHQLAGNTLANYEIKTIEVELSQEEQEQYLEARKIYTNFLKENRIHFSQGGAWQEFIRIAHRSERGREAFQAFLKQKKIAQSSQSKFQVLWDLFLAHPQGRILIFTQDNETAYEIGRRFFLPVLTHHTKIKERESFLTRFRSGDYRILVTSKVLNEGVDVPEANVAIVFSGSGTVREHVQRLGRILRAKEGKKAILYELVSANTGETFVNQRRREHSAYQERTH